MADGWQNANPIAPGTPEMLSVRRHPVTRWWWVTVSDSYGRMICGQAYRTWLHAILILLDLRHQLAKAPSGRVRDVLQAWGDAYLRDMGPFRDVT